MKRNVIKKTAKQSTQRVKKDKTIDTDLPYREYPEETIESAGNEMELGASNTDHETQDRGDDLINMRDPLVQGPERDAEIPPEFPQKRASLFS